MKKQNAVMFLVMFLAMTFFSGCWQGMGDSDKVKLISVSVELATFTGAQIVMLNEPKAALYLEGIADVIDLAIRDGVTDPDLIRYRVAENIAGEVPDEYQTMVRLMIPQALIIYDIFVTENEAGGFIEEKKSILTALVRGIRLGMVVKATIEPTDGLPKKVKREVFRLKG